MKSGRGLPNLSAPVSHAHNESENLIEIYNDETDLTTHINGGDVSSHFDQHQDHPASFERADSIISDNMSHLSMEVNTTGTGSVMGYESSDQEQEVQDDAFDNLI